MTDRYNPPDHLVDKLVAERTPRQLAIAYMRATRRAQDAEVAYAVQGELEGALLSAMRGDGEGAADSLKGARAVLRSHKEARE